jgi:hypothetical protein
VLPVVRTKTSTLSLPETSAGSLACDVSSSQRVPSRKQRAIVPEADMEGGYLVT